jgi:hypothetical protein
VIDGIKLKIVSMILAKKLQQHPLLANQFEITTDSDTGALVRYRTKYLGFTIIILHDKYITIEGSIHKFWCGGFNHTDFNYTDFRQAIQRLSDLLNLDLSKAKIERFEAGVNVRLKIPAVDFVQNLRCFDLMPFSYDQPIARKRHLGKHFKRTQYEVKCYSKSTLARVDDINILRFEVRFRKMELVKELGIKTVEDLSCPSKYQKLSQELITYYERISLLEPTLELKEVIKPRERELLLRGCDAQYWDDLRNVISRQAISAKKRKYQILEARHSLKSLKAETLKLIRKRLVSLCNG